MNKQLLALKHQLSVRRIFIDGSIFSALAGALVLGSMYYNIEIYHDDYPPDIQAKVPPMSQRAKKQRVFVALALFSLFFAMPIWSNLKLKRQRQGNLSFLAALLNAYAVFEVANLFDLLVIDYLFVIGLHPDFIVLPGTEGMASYYDYRSHFVGFLKGSGYGLIPALLIAFLTSRQDKKRSIK